MVPGQRAYVVCVCEPRFFRNYWTRHDIAVCVKVDNFAVIQCVESISCFYIPTKIKRELLSYLFFFWPNVSIDKADFSLPSSIIAIWNIYQYFYRFVFKIFWVSIYFMPLVSFYTPWKHQKTRDFVMFEGV